MYSPQGDPNDEGALPEFTNAARVRALLDFWQQVQAKANFTAHPRRLALEWHAESGGKPVRALKPGKRRLSARKVKRHVGVVTRP